MDHKEGEFRKICFHCASIYETKDGEILMCPVCGKSILSSEYERVMRGRQSDGGQSAYKGRDNEDGFGNTG